MVYYLLQRGAEINARTVIGNTALYYAALEGHHLIVKLLLAQGADIQIKGENYYFPIHAAAIKGHLNVMTVLLEHDASLINKLSPIGELSPLSLAMKAGHFTLVKYLLSPEREPKANVNIGNIVDVALKCDNLITRNNWIALILEHDVNISVIRLFTYDIKKLYEATIKKGQFKLVTRLFNKYPELLLRNYDYPSHCHALFMAVEEGQLAIVRYLIQLRIHNPSYWHDHETLNSALQKGHDEIAIELIEAKITGGRELADVLKLSSKHQRTGVVAFLLDKYSHLRPKDLSPVAVINKTSTEIKPIEIKPGETVKTQLVLKTKPKSRLMKAVRQGDLALVQTILHENPDSLEKNRALSLAAKKGHVEICKVFIQQNVNFFRVAPPFTKTALDLAAEHKHYRVVALLLKEAGNDLIAKAATFLANYNLMKGNIFTILARCDELALALAKIIEKVGRHYPTINYFSSLVETNFNEILRILDTTESQHNILFLSLLSDSQKNYVLEKLTSPLDRYRMRNQISVMQSRYPKLAPLLENLRQCCIKVINQNFSQNFKKFYLANCHFAFFGNTLRSEMGKKVFNYSTITENEVRSYLSKNAVGGASAKALREMRANSLYP